MASSSSDIPSDADPTAHGQPPGATPSSVASDLPPSSNGDISAESESLLDIFNLGWQRQGMPDTEFNRKYPPYAWGKEMAPNARVWKIYRDIQDASHNGMLEGWNKTLDVLLIFAGLFSAVLTAFLIESYKALQPDYTEYVAAFLYAAAVSHNRTGGVFPALGTIVAPDLFVQTSAAQRWTNGLWFSSLVISLAVALLCILIKQWLDAYDSHVVAAAPTPIYWARRHSLYHRGLTKWGVPGLISFLPLLLHLSLFLFFVGLILFLRPLDGAISYSLLVMVSCIGAFYILSLVLPVWRVECPSYTPLLAQALLLVSRPISDLLHVVDRLEIWTLHLPCHAVSILVIRAGIWLESIQERSEQQLARETHTISKCDVELDGYVLSALIDLPTDTNLDFVNAACAALGAVTSTCTMEVISRNRPGSACLLSISDCYDGIPWAETGFAITSGAQLRRARLAMLVQDGSPFFPSWDPEDPRGPQSSLGIDGMLLNILEDRDDSMHRRYINLIPQLQSLPLSGSGSPGFPFRSTCLMFMSHYGQRPALDPPLLSCFLLIFCAGRFEDAETHELVRALRNVAAVLEAQCTIPIPAHNGAETDYISAVINGLWLMLADPERYHVDALTAQMVAYHACNSVSWVQMSGLSAFLRSPTFYQCVSTTDRLAKYRQLAESWWPGGCSEAQVAEYWLCCVTLLRLSWDYASRNNERAYIFRGDVRSPIRCLEWGLMFRSELAPYATPDDWYEPILRAILDSPNAIATWTVANSPDQDDKCVIELAKLAYRISIVLCRRQRLGRANDVFTRGFFCRTFLLMRFQDLISREHIRSDEPRFISEEILIDLAKHCLKLSPASFLEICTQLEETGDADSDLRARAIASAQRIRNGSGPAAS